MNRTSFLISALCVIVQYYDYHLFGFLAAKISKYCLPASDPVVQLMKTYLIMALAVGAKPFGALILGRIGDIYGRVTTIVISLLGTACASFVISMTPSYGQIGIASAIILFCARMVVTALVSSGTDGIRIYIYEQIGVKRQCLGNGLISTAAQIGSFSASMSGLLLTLDFLPDYAWRFAFLFGSVLGICVAILRVKYPDSEEVISKNTPEYDIYKDVNTFTIVFRNFKMFLKCSILAGCIGSTYQFIIIFFGTYNFEILKFISASKMQFYTSVGVILYMTFAIIGGLCADVFGRRIVAIVASYVVVLLSVIMSYTIAHNVIPISVYFLINIALPFLTMPALAFLKQSIPTVIRYRIFSLAHAFGSLIISAPTAFISTYIFHKTSINWLPMVYFIVANIAIIVVILSINQPKDESSLRAKYSNPVTIFRNTHYDR